MQKKSKRHLRIGLVLSLVFMMVVAVSYTFPGGPAFSGGSETGTFLVTSEFGGERHELEGYVYFEISESDMGEFAPPVFKLHFISSEREAGRGIGFMIPLSANSKPIAPEHYKVATTENGFLKRFESVFGYADLEEAGGSLFFTESGGISIRHSTEREVTGDVNMMLRDNTGQRMKLEGSFNARPLIGSSGR